MVLCVSGRLTPEKVLEYVDKRFQNKAVSRPEIRKFIEPASVVSPYVEKELLIGNTIFSIGIKDVEMPSDSKERFKRAESINILLNMMFSESGEFYLEMLNEGLLSPGFDVGYSSNSTTAYVMMSGESDEPRVLLERIKEYIKKCLENGFDERDFNREKKCMYASYVLEFDSTEDIVFSLNSYAWEGIDLFEYPKIIGEIRFEDMIPLAKDIFKDEFFTLSVVKPQGKEDKI